MLKNNRGFSIPELLVVIVVIGILAGLVIVNFSGIQPRARDSERQTDIETLATHLENTFQREGQYPSTATMTGSASTVQAALKDLQPSTLAAPGVAVGTNSVVSFTAAPPVGLTGAQYGYWTPSASASCTANYTLNCATFVLVYIKEADSTHVYVCGRGANINNTKAIFPGPNGMPSFQDAWCSNF